MGKTKVIAIEGIDGSGKSVQFRLLKRALERAGRSVDAREYPVYGSYFGGLAGQYLSGQGEVRADAVDGKSMALWFALDRWEDLKGYRDGDADYMLINRYVLSNAVYQSIRDIDMNRPDIIDWVFDLEYVRFGLPRADLFLLYDVDAACAGKNVMKKGFRDYVGGRGKDVYEASGGIQLRARVKYLETAAGRDDIAVIGCMDGTALRPAEELAAETLKVLKARGMV